MVMTVNIAAWNVNAGYTLVHNIVSNVSFGEVGGMTPGGSTNVWGAITAVTTVTNGNGLLVYNTVTLAVPAYRRPLALRSSLRRIPTGWLRVVSFLRIAWRTHAPSWTCLLRAPPPAVSAPHRGANSGELRSMKRDPHGGIRAERCVVAAPLCSTSQLVAPVGVQSEVLAVVSDDTYVSVRNNAEPHCETHWTACFHAGGAL